MDAFTRDLDAATTRGSNIMPGVAAAAVDKTGKHILSHASGYLSVAPDAAPISLDSIFTVASCTKLVTTIACVQCLERGLITLDEPVNRVLPELDRFEISAGSKANDAGFTLAKPKNKITLRHLMTHTSGMAYDARHPILQAWRVATGEATMSLAGKIVGGLDHPLVFEPGTSWTYGVGLDWAGLLVGRLNNMRFGEYCQKYIFDPLGMGSTTFHLDQRPDLRERFVQMSVRTAGDEVRLIAGHSGYVDPARDECGGVGLYTSVSDYLRVLADLLKDQPTLFKQADTVDLLFAPQLDTEQQLDALSKSSAIWTTYMKDPNPKLNHSVAGLLVLEDGPVSGTPKNTVRWSGYTGPRWAVNREKGLAFFWATQILPGPDVENGKWVERFGRLVFGHPN